MLQIETFEASPEPEAVVNCAGRLQCTFPGPVTQIPWSVAMDKSFREQLGAFLHHMDIELFAEETLSKSWKGGNQLPETRDVPHPKYITELLTGMMRGIGKEVRVDRITKHLRDEVNWKKARNPWRRSGTWLVLRVALQTTLSKLDYKNFLLEVIRVILKESIKKDIDTYSISCISKKLSRRAEKIGGDDIPPTLLEKLERTISQGSRLLGARWEAAIKKSEREVKWPNDENTTENINRNIILPMVNSGGRIDSRIETYEHGISVEKKVPDPTEPCRSKNSLDFPVFNVFDGEEVDSAISLIDFENWISEFLGGWCFQNPHHIIIRTLSAQIEGDVGSTR
ncbi:hypothetical protein ABW19_dt0210632 [Dactylella cylindrospora]|nr:hypothetical protein ABW19_dt0210632 [Dactylella cylindrospora]